MNDKNGKKIEVGDIIYYAKFSDIELGKVLKVFRNALNVTCSRRHGYVEDSVPLKGQTSYKRINIYVQGGGTNQVLIKRKKRQ